MLRAQALFALAWFHAVMQERRMYIPQGWTKFYEFSTSDLRAGADIIDRLCKGGERFSVCIISVILSIPLCIFFWKIIG